MPVQDFTDQEKATFAEAAAQLISNPEFAAARQNMTKAQQKAQDAAAVQAKIDSLQSAIDNADTYFDTLKTAEVTKLTAKKLFLVALKTKIENLPE